MSEFLFLCFFVGLRLFLLLRFSRLFEFFRCLSGNDRFSHVNFIELDLRKMFSVRLFIPKISSRKKKERIKIRRLPIQTPI